MRLALVAGVIGQLLRVFSATFFAPAALAAFDRDFASVGRFVGAFAFTFVLGAILRRGGRASTFHRSEALAVVAFTWAAIALCGAIPYVLEGLSPIDAYFESMSGFTTTGATVLSDFSGHGRAFFLWRAMTQWFGGLGVIALFVVVLPRLGIAGRQLFFAEASSAPSEAVSPSVRTSAQRLWVLYVVLTGILTVALLICGFPLYDALAHALTTLPAGGFSPHAQSVAGYGNPAAEWVLAAFMLLAGSSYPLQLKAFTGRLRAFLEDGEFLVYVAIAVLIAVGLGAVLAQGLPTLETLRHGFFQSASLISSTGYASADFALWSDAAKALLVLAMLVNGCAGSAGGGPKVVRLVIVFKHVVREVTHVLHPRAVLPIRYHGRPVARDVVRAVFTLFTLYFVGYVLVGAVLVLLGSSIEVGFSASLACLGNVGPGFGAAGPMGSFAGFSPVAKVVLTLAMWLGRLEIVTVLALLHPDVWRRLRRG